MGLLETDTFSGIDFTGVALIGSYTAVAEGFVAARVRVAPLVTGQRQTITLRTIVNDGTDDYPAERASGIKDADADTRFQRLLPPVWLSSGDVLKVYGSSSHVDDDDIDGSVAFIDSGNPVDAVVASEVTGEINTAAGTITTLDLLDSVQDSQHQNTQQAVSIQFDNITDGSTPVRANNAAGGAIPTAAEINAAVEGGQVGTDAAAAKLAAESAATIGKTRVVDNGDGTKWLQVYPSAVDVTPTDPPAGWTYRLMFNAKGEQIDREDAA